MVTGKISKIHNKNGEAAYPVTITKAVYMDDGNTTLEKKINHIDEQFNTKASKEEARLKTVKIELEDLSENTLGAMSGSSTFSLLSIPQDKSVTNAKLNLPKNILPKTFTFTKGDIDSGGSPVVTNYRCITEMISVKKGDYIGIVDTNNIKFKWAIYADDTLSGFTSYRTEGYVFPNDAKIRIIQNKTDDPISDINYMNNNIYICDNETAMTKSEVLSKINENITPVLPKNDTFYVAHDGLDTNDGLTSTTPFATFEKAISSGATTIYAKKGNYYGTKIVASNLKKLKIISYGEGSYITLNNTDSLSPLVYPLVLTNIDELELNSIKITDAGVKGFKIWGCNGKLTNCICEKSTSDGFSLDGSNLKLYSCIAKNSARDGFNIHEYNGSACHTEFYNCKSYNSGDDGISHHENCTAYIQGGEFSNSVSGGVTPYGQAKVDVYNALIQNNGSGIHAFQSGTILDNPTINVVNCILKGNTTGIIAQYYNIISANTKFVENITNTNEISGTITTI